MFTAFSIFKETQKNEKGGIEVGKLADFTILSADIMTIPMDDIPNLEAEQVFVDGNLVK